MGPCGRLVLHSHPRIRQDDPSSPHTQFFGVFLAAVEVLGVFHVPPRAMSICLSPSTLNRMLDMADCLIIYAGATYAGTAHRFAAQ